MGGTVTIILRKPDGTEYRMQRWTNIIPYFLSNIRLAEENENHVQAFLEQWLIMKDDYERHKSDKKFEHSMTDVYFPSEGIVPSEYGIIIIDMRNKVILDCFQFYHRIGYLDAFHFVFFIQSQYRFCTKEEIKAEIAHYREPLTKNRIKKIYNLESNSNKKLVKVPVPIPHTFREFARVLRSNENAIIELDMSPYTIERYAANETEKALSRIKSLGFILTPEEETQWQDEWQDEL